jgi:hypothetical protein
MRTEGNLARIFIGTLLVVVETPQHIRSFDRQEELEVAQGVVARLQSGVSHLKLPFELEFVVVATSSGCIKVKLAVYLVAALTTVSTAFDFISKYKHFRESVPLLIEDTGNTFNCVIRGQKQACRLFQHTNQLSQHLYQVVDGDTLSGIVMNKWKVPSREAQQVMNTILKNHPEAFINGDIDRLKAGALIAAPTAEMKRGVPGGAKAH